MKRFLAALLIALVPAFASADEFDVGIFRDIKADRATIGTGGLRVTGNLTVDGRISDNAVQGKVLYVDTVDGSTSYDCLTWDKPCDTMSQAFGLIDDNGIIYVTGDVREEVSSPLGVQGVRIIGASGGNNRHDDGVRWREPASGATSGGSLLTIREQGWEVHNILFVPKSDGTALALKRREDGVDPDGSHAIIANSKFIGAATATTIGIEDDGGTHHVLIYGCEFFTLNSAIVNTSTTIANPLRWVIRNNIFMDNTEHIDMPFTESVVKDNVFDEGTTNVEVDGGSGGNFVLDNYFMEAEAAITNGNGYAAGTADVWRNFSEDVAATTAGAP